MTSYCWIGQVGSPDSGQIGDRWNLMHRMHLMLVVLALAIAGIVAAGGYMVRSRAAAVCDPTRDVFLVRQHREPGASVRAVTFFKVQPTADQRDVELGTLEIG